MDDGIVYANRPGGPADDFAVPGEAMDLIGQIVSANVSNLAHSTDLVEEGLRREIMLLASRMVRIGEILDSATVIDRKTEYALANLDYWFDHACEIVEREEASA